MSRRKHKPKPGRANPNVTPARTSNVEIKVAIVALIATLLQLVLDLLTWVEPLIPK